MSSEAPAESPSAVSHSIDDVLAKDGSTGDNERHLVTGPRAGTAAGSLAMRASGVGEVTPVCRRCVRPSLCQAVQLDKVADRKY